MRAPHLHLCGPGVSPLLWFQTYLQAQRSLLLQGQESLSSATQSIERSQRIATETDHIGTEIIEELGGQREQLERSRNRVSLPLWGRRFSKAWDCAFSL